MKIAFDSNVLLYVAQVWKVDADQAKTGKINTLLLDLNKHAEMIVPFQVFGECFHVMQRYGYTREKCRAIILDWSNIFETRNATPDTFFAALNLATDHKLQFWDALIMNAAADAGCTLLLSEDLQPGFSWRGVSVVNPFAEVMDKQLVRALER